MCHHVTKNSALYKNNEMQIIIIIIIIEIS
jgi:hypothetical protein